MGALDQVPRPQSAIGDYALIGDCRGAALVGREGSIDWLCWPRFDSPSLFAAILDDERGGRFRVRPQGPYRAERRYTPDTNVLETTFQTATGTVVLRDLMPVASEAEKRAGLVAEHEVLRELEGVAGYVDVDVVYEPRPNYGRDRPGIRCRGAFGLWCEAGRGMLVLRSHVPMSPTGDGASAYGVARVDTGDRIHFSLTYSEQSPAVVPPLGPEATKRIERSLRWWRDWAGRCTYRGPHRAAVVRSLLALKLLTYAPSGAIVAAPTTSLPEKIGGERNWDYRYCWLRDASFTLRALFECGYAEEANAFQSWMLHATRLTRPALRVVYDVFGEDHIPERQLDHLAGYRDSRPVRAGNGAFQQFQLDVYGEVLDGVARGRGSFDGDTARLLEGFGRTVCEHWREPDDGIWEARSGRSHHTHSKALCWVALDRLLAMHDAGRLRLSADRFRRERDAIRAEIETRGYNHHIASYTALLDGEDVDASLLTLPLHGYIDAAAPRMRATYARIQAKLAHGPLVRRYESRSDVDGLPPGEGTFGICGFWAVECRALAGDVVGASAAFEQLLGYANDVGLFAEEIDQVTGEALGNYPQAFTHVGLVNAAATLARLQESGRTPPPAGANIDAGGER